MVKIKEFVINLDENKNEFFAGEVVSGNVVLEFVDSTPVIRVVLYAQGVGISTTGRPCTEHIYRNTITLFGTPHNSPDEYIQPHPAGKQTYPFTFSLPAELPSSVKEDRHGSIKYFLKAKVELKGLISSLFSSGDSKVKRPIKVKEIIDANIPRYELQDVQTAKKIPGIFSNQKKLDKDDILVTLGRGVCCPGEKAKIQLQFKSGIAKKMAPVKVRLNKYVHFNKKVNKVPYKKMITEINNQRRNNEKIYQKIVELPIPKDTSPTNTLTNAIVLNYVLHVKFDGYREIKLPIIIGTIPFDESLQNEQQQTAIVEPTQLPFNPEAEVTSIIIPRNSPSAPTMDNDDTEASGYESSSPPSYSSNGLNSSEIQCEFHHPPPYIPEDEFDLPPSYEEAITTSSNNQPLQLVEAN